MTFKKIAIIFICLFFFGCEGAQSHDPDIYAEMEFYAEEESKDISTLLNQIRDAIGIVTTSTLDFSIEGETEFMGNAGHFTFAVNSDENIWFTAFEGPIEYAFGYYSDDHIVKFMNGIIRKAGPNETSRSRLHGYVFSHMWLLENTTFRWNLESNENSNLLLYYQLVDTYSWGVIHIDRETYLPVKWVNHSWEGEEVFQFEGSFDDQSPWIPAYIEITDNNGVTTQTRITNRRTNNQHISDHLSRHFVQENDFYFDTNREASLVLRRSWRGQPMVQASVNNSDPVWFFLDSGAGISVLDNRLVEKLNMEEIGYMDLRGVGGSQHASFHRADQFSIGPLTIQNYLVSALDLSFLDQIFDEPIAGIIGSGVFGRSIVEIDVEKSRVALYDSSEFEDDEFNWFPMLVDDGTPIVEGKLEGNKGFFMLDTGKGAGALAIHSQAVADFKLLESRQIRTDAIGGVGGQMRVQRGIIDTFEIGPFAHHEVDASFLDETGGSFSNPYHIGTVGMRILRDYRIIFDYKNERISLIATH